MTNKLSRNEAIQIIDSAINHIEDYWEDSIEIFHDMELDELPSRYDIFLALGITKKEYIEATNSNEEHVFWPTGE